MAKPSPIQQKYRDATYNRAQALAEAGKGSSRAMQYLIWLIDHGESQEIRRRAAMDVLAYGVGKPIERVADVTDEKGRDPTDIELARALIDRGYRITGCDLVDPESAEKLN